MKPVHHKRLGKASSRIMEAWNRGGFPAAYPNGKSASVRAFMDEWNRSGDDELAVQAVEALAQTAPIIKKPQSQR